MVHPKVENHAILKCIRNKDGTFQEVALNFEIRNNQQETIEGAIHYKNPLLEEENDIEYNDESEGSSSYSSSSEDSGDWYDEYNEDSESTSSYNNSSYEDFEEYDEDDGCSFYASSSSWED